MTPAPQSGDPGAGYDRRSFLQSSGGVATAVAVTVLPTAAAAAVLVAPAGAATREAPLGPEVAPTGDVPSETVMAYVQDAVHGDVTVVAGDSQMTFRDPVLAKRLLDAARVQTT